MGRINTYPEASSSASDDYLVLDGSTNGTRKIKPSRFVDPTGTQSGMAADAKTTEDKIEEIKNNLSGIETLFVISNNLFDKDDADIVLNSEIAANGTISEKSNYFVSGYIPVKYGETYTLSYPSSNYGTNSRVVTYNANKERIGYRNASARASESPYWITFTADAQSESITNADVAYVRYTGFMPNIDSYRFVEGTEYSEFMPYGKKQLASDVRITDDNLGEDFKISPDNTTFIKVSSKNLLNIDAMVVGDLSNQAGSANVLPQNTGYLTTDFVPVEPGKTYALYAPVFPYGVNNYRGIPCYNSDKEFVGYTLPNQTLAAGPPLPCTITIPSGAAYIRNCYPNSYNNWKQKYIFVILESDTIPNGTYIPYQVEMKFIGAGIEDDYSEIYNPLIGKIAVWDGDSICAADNDSLGGWPMRIGMANHMDIKSYAVSGATITSNTSANHWISESIDTIAEAYPNADYVIIDGGTNDADQLRDVEGGIGVFDADDFSTEYISALDKDTFSGALEYVFYKMVTVWKGKHLGYVIPQKMGTGSAAVAGRITFFNRAREIAAKWGIPVLDLWNNYYFNWQLSAHYDSSKTADENNAAGNLYRDGQHLTDAGYAIQSPVIAEWMKCI